MAVTNPRNARLSVSAHGAKSDRKEQPMKPFARIDLSSVLSSVALAKVDALRRGIFVLSLAREERD